MTKLPRHTRQGCAIYVIAQGCRAPQDLAILSLKSGVVHLIPLSSVHFDFKLFVLPTVWKLSHDLTIPCRSTMSGSSSEPGSAPTFKLSAVLAGHNGDVIPPGSLRIPHD